MTSTTRILLAMLAAAATVVVVRTVVTRPSSEAAAPATAQPIAAAILPVVPPDDEVHAGYAGSATCLACHAAEYQAWLESNHGLAERHYRKETDDPAFTPQRTLTHGDDVSETFLDADGVAKILTRGFGGERRAYPVPRVIGNRPLRQFMIPGPRGRLQVCDVSYDPKANEWFDVFGGDERKPGDWGHWTGQAMNWNSMCAACHNTRVRKNFDAKNDSYRTRMAEMSVGCESCHGPMKAHVDWQQQNPTGSGAKDPTARRIPHESMLQTCGACHARRGEITGDMVPGEPFSDHFSLTVTDETDIYHPDGQVRDENFEYASFLSSRMHHAGVRCIDCHDPHSGKRLMPGNQLCMRCHDGGNAMGAPVIDPLAHSRHAPDSPGNDCTSCHMPQTTYMQRHPRHDHGFTIPDPLLTKHFGTPNACNRCHTDQDADWAIRHTEAWYGERMNRPTRERAFLIAKARRGDPDARDGLINLLRNEPIDAWRASACHLLERWSMQPQAADALTIALKDQSPLVREAAVHSLMHRCRAGDPATRAAVQPLLNDPLRAVRVAAAWVLAGEVDLNSQAGRELVHMLDHNADHPTGRMRLGQFAHLRGDQDAAIGHIRKAIEIDPNSALCHHDLAILLSVSGRANEALAALREAVKLAPDEAEYHFKLGLAHGETGNTREAAAALAEAVRLDPSHARAWYNLGLAHSAIDQPGEAIDALLRAEAAEPSDPAIPYARATIHARLGQRAEAIKAADRAIALDPEFIEAIRLRQALSQ
jgi:predicted CXXCH cytochrome family protein